MKDDIAQLLFGMERLAGVVRAGHWQNAGLFGLVPTQAEIMMRIAQRPMRPVDIAAHLSVSAASTSDSISSLVTKGFAERLPDPSDGRARLLVPTEKGLRVAEALASASTPLEGAVSSLPPEDLAALLRAVSLVIRSLQEAGAIPVQRMCITCRYFRPHQYDDADRPHHCEFVNAPFGNAKLRIDCGDHDAAEADLSARHWRRFEEA